jgi:hypothetical protein
MTMTQLQKTDGELENLIINGDLSRLSEAQRMSYYRKRCESLGLDPLSRPFDYIKLQGKLTLYLNRGGGEQVRRNHGVSITVTDKVFENDVYTVFVRATTKDGRIEDECGSVAANGAKGEAFANIQMKAITKAKRRATISICGLGMLDESEVEGISARPNNLTVTIHPKVEAPPKDDRLITREEGEELKEFAVQNKVTNDELMSLLLEMGIARLGELTLKRSGELWDKIAELHTPSPQKDEEDDKPSDQEINPPF